MHQMEGRYMRPSSFPYYPLGEVQILVSSKPPKIPQSVLVVIHTTDLQVLLIERADKLGFWQSVTGSKDSTDEPLVETCVREVFEETGIVVEQRFPLPQRSLALASARRYSGQPVLQPVFPPSPPAEAGEGVRQVPLTHLTDWQLENIYAIYPEWQHRYAPGVTHNTERVFGLLVPRDIAITLSPREHVRYEWLPYLAAADKCFSSSNAEAILQLPNFIHAK
jgi:dihydroneopterin triphosphate diphosphatase